jgi:hypothetical protein
MMSTRLKSKNSVSTTETLIAGSSISMKSSPIMRWASQANSTYPRSQMTGSTSISQMLYSRRARGMRTS